MNKSTKKITFKIKKIVIDNMEIKNKFDCPNPPKSITTNMEPTIKIYDNLQSKTRFNRKCYYNVYSKEKADEAQKKGEYTKPLEYALSLRKAGEYTIKCDELKGVKTHRSYGNFNLKDLEEYGWKTDNHLFEVISPIEPIKLYFDIDKRKETDEDMEIILKLLLKLVKRTLEIDIGDESALCYGEGQKEDYQKISFHLISCNGTYFKNMNDLKTYTSYLKYVIGTEVEYEPLRNGILDFNVYKKNQVFKLPYNTKVGKNSIVQKPMELEDDWSWKMTDFLITHLVENPKFYDVSKFVGFNVKSVKIKTACNKVIKVDFDKAILLNDFREHIGKNFKLPKVEESRLKQLEYYIASIPNSSNNCRCGQKCGKMTWKAVGYCISNITKNSEYGFNLWYNWTNNGDKVKMLEEYTQHSTIKGYGWKTLYDLAQIYNKDMGKYEGIYDPLFNDKPPFKCDSKKINNKFIDCEKYNMIENLDTYDNIFISSPMGSGKSYTLKKVFNDFDKYKSILYFSCKRAFASSMMSEFGKFGFTNYLGVSDKSSIINKDRIICSVESIRYCRDSYDLVIIDESESIANNLTGQMFINNNPLQGATKIYDIIKNSSKIMVMDAYISERSFNMIGDIKKDTINDEKNFYLKNEFKNEERYYIEVSQSSLVKEIGKKLVDKKRCVLVCGSRKLSDAVKQEYGSYNIKSYDAKNPLVEKTNVNEEWSNCDILIYTPTITAGISYDPTKDGVKEVSKHFDTLFIYAVNKGSCHFRDTIQASRRCRDFKDRHIYLCINDKFKGLSSTDNPLTKDEIREIEDKYKHQLFGQITSVCDEEKLKYLYNINIHNKLESNISQKLLRGFAKKYLDLENIISKGQNLDAESLDMIDDKWDFDKIVDIGKALKNEYETRMSFGVDILDEEETKELIKYNYINKHLRTDLEEGVGKDYFNEFYGDTKKRQQSSSIRGFKNMLYEIKYDYTKYPEYEKKVSGNMPIEFYNMKYKRWEHIIRFMDRLGLLTEGGLNIDTEFNGFDFKKCINDYKSVDIKSLNTMLSDNYIRITKKDTFQELNQRNIQGIFNNLIKEEFGLEVFTTRYKRTKYEGKKTRITYMAVRNFLPDIKDDFGKKEESKTKELHSKFHNPKYNLFNMFREEFGEDTKIEDYGESSNSEYDDGFLSDNEGEIDELDIMIEN